ncbi:hypothetical protein MKK58_24345 [Methylobacterium sp. J-078]|uniref:hypothetical protein n=1 Tax=Methylobacterium sp. J-078 TaxID=2836657 RepID=UPI001FB9863D|nr:hypothetical protein [Methylobacterium sp. J-078]MCJ2047645.1 hypothetical protein [Methylobacterium sp. J-078]
MSVRRFLGAVIAATLAALAAAPKLIWEGGRWILRSLAPPQQAAQAPGELVEQVEELVAETETKAAMTSAGVHKADIRPTHHTDLGRAALQYLMPMEGDDETIAVMLDDQAKDYLDSLPRDRLALLVNFRPEQIGRHLTREVPIATMPRVPSYREYTQSLYDRLAAEGHNPDPCIVQSIRRADVDEEPQDGVRYGMR